MLVTKEDVSYLKISLNYLLLLKTRTITVNLMILDLEKFVNLMNRWCSKHISCSYALVLVKENDN